MYGSHIETGIQGETLGTEGCVNLNVLTASKEYCGQHTKPIGRQRMQYLTNR